MTAAFLELIIEKPSKRLLFCLKVPIQIAAEALPHFKESSLVKPQFREARILKISI